MAIVAKINTTGSIGRTTLNQSNKTTIVSNNFRPRPNVSINEVGGVSTEGVANGYTFVFNSTTNTFEVQPTADLTGTITIITGGTF
tara:strand:- start:228 stop:485 length:258 start_codon:yes stop_codon:yes gene_type:complete